MKKIVVLSFVTLFYSIISLAQQSTITGKSIQDSVVLSHMPEWGKPVLEKSDIVKQHKILQNFNPYYFESDFNGDKVIDIAFFVENTIDKSKGVLIINGGKNLVYVLGCGNSTPMGSSLVLAKSWIIFREKMMRNPARKSFSITEPAIILNGSRENNLAIYWSGNKYKTMLQQY